MPLQHRHASFGGLLLGALGALVVACTSTTPTTPSSSPHPSHPIDAEAGDADERPQSAPLRIGVYLPLSGPEAAFGKDAKEGMNLAVRQADVIRGRPVELVYMDDESNPIAASNAVLGFAKDPSIVAILGEVASSRSQAGGIVANKRQVPMLTPASTNPEVTKIGPFVFRACFDDEAQGRAAARYLIQVRKRKKLGVLWAQDDLYSATLARAFREEAARLFATVSEQSFSRNETSFKEELAELKKKGPDIIYTPLYYNIVPAILRDGKTVGLSGSHFFGGDGWHGNSLIEKAGAAAEGAEFTESWVVDVPSEENQAFVQAYRDRYKHDPSSVAAMGYDAAGLLFDAIKRAPSEDREAIRDALASTRGFRGVTGTITMGRDRNPETDVVIVRVDHGQFRYASRVRSVDEKRP